MISPVKNRASVLCWIVIILLTSCYPNTYHELVFQNDSSYDIWVIENHYYIVDSIPYDTDSTYVKSGTEEVFDVASGEVVTLADFDTCLKHIRQHKFLSCVVANNDSLEVQIDMNDPNNWVNTVFEVRRKGSGSCECRITIDDTDIH